MSGTLQWHNQNHYMASSIKIALITKLLISRRSLNSKVVCKCTQLLDEREDNSCVKHTHVY